MSTDSQAVAILLKKMEGWRNRNYEVHHATFPGGDEFADAEGVTAVTCGELFGGRRQEYYGLGDVQRKLEELGKVPVKPDRGLVWLMKNPFFPVDWDRLKHEEEWSQQERKTEIMGQVGIPSRACVARRVFLGAREGVYAGKYDQARHVQTAPDYYRYLHVTNADREAILGTTVLLVEDASRVTR